MTRFSQGALCRLAQVSHAERMMAEYLRRLEAEGFKLGTGATWDEVIVSSDEESVRADAIFKEVCEEHIS